MEKAGPTPFTPREAHGAAARASENTSQTLRAFVRVHELLLQGAFQPGERLTELQLAAQFGMSRTPIRTALERLAHLGLLDFGGTGGFRVPQFTIAEALDAIELRGLLEGAAARLAAERLSGNDELDTVKGHCSRMEALPGLTADTFQAVIDLNEAFHYAIVDLAKSTALRRQVEQVYALPFAAPSVMICPTLVLPNPDTALAIASDQHRAIVDAIAKRQSQRAEHLMREHAYGAGRVLESSLSNADALSRIPGGVLMRLTHARHSSR